MRFLDLLRMSGGSLWKRKVRTFLTVLGVIIGTASIVVMISLGLGLNKSSMEMIEQYGGLTTIEVMENNGGGGSYYGTGMVAMDSGAAEEKKQEIKHLDDKLVEKLKTLEHVEDVYPVLSTSAIAKFGVYENYLNIQGMSLEALEKLNIPLEKGSLPTGEDEKLELLYGNMIMQGFSNSKTGKGYWETGTLPDIDLLNDPMFVIFDMDAYNKIKWGEKTDIPIVPPKKYVISASGLVAGGMEEYNTHSWNVYCEINALKKQLKKIFKNKPIPGQPTLPSGKPYKEIYYNSIKVNVDNMDNMADLQKQITDMGYQANSNAEWIESQKQQAGYMQAVLGGIGAVSLFVAAIGITNTMMMSIYERTKEIGIMKVLGCDMRNIRTQFLMEAGYIGFIGGIFGLILSFGISALINVVVKSSDLGTTSLSYIPPWLGFLSIGFAVGVGMIAGFFPALRAMKLSPLAAIRNE